MREAAQSVPHWYLVAMGVDPARQGLGLGSLLLRRGLSRVDQEGVECHLFTERSRNVSLYQRYGFEIAVEGDVPDGGPHFWFMRRRRLPGVRRPPHRETPRSTLTQSRPGHHRFRLTVPLRGQVRAA